MSCARLAVRLRIVAIRVLIHVVVAFSFMLVIVSMAALDTYGAKSVYPIYLLIVQAEYV
jgi:hypothetical protein